MVIETLSLENFRNIGSAELSPCTGINILFGPNAQGKTNVIEAIWLCTGSHSFRGAKESQMARFGEGFFRITLQFKDRERSQEIRYSSGEKRRKLALNGVPLKSPGELTGVFPAVVFDPTELSIVREGPGERRRFLDGSISQVKPVYRRYLDQYQAVLDQRNSLLRNERYRGYSGVLEVWDTQLAKIGSILSIYRADYLKKLCPIAGEIYEGFTGKAEAFSAGYESTVFPEGTALEVYSDQLISFYQAALEESLENDLRMGFTTRGIHRDDISLSVNHVPVKAFGSRGQQRSCAVALKLGEAKLYQGITGENPVVLLDDVMSELDQDRQDYILNRIKGFQVFVTCCDISNTLRMESGSVFSVDSGKIILQ